MLSCVTYVTKERFILVKRAETYLAVRIVRERSRRVSRGETAVPVLGLPASGFASNKRISFQSKVEFFFSCCRYCVFCLLSVEMCPWYKRIETPYDQPVSAISQTCPGKTAADIMHVQISQRADEKTLIEFFCTTTQLNILTTCAVKVVVGCNNNVRGSTKTW